MKAYQRLAITAVAVAATGFMVTACTSGGSQDELSRPSSVIPTLASDQEAMPEGTPFATEPEIVDVAVPDAVDPGEPSDLDGRQVLPAVPLDVAVADVDRGVTVWLGEFNPNEAAGSRPGEIGGPAIQFELYVHNGGHDLVDLATFVVSVTYGEPGRMAEDVVTEDSRPLVGLVHPDETLRGTFVFVVPPEERDGVVISVDIASDARIMVFRGDAPR